MNHLDVRNKEALVGWEKTEHDANRVDFTQTSRASGHTGLVYPLQSAKFIIFVFFGFL